MSSDETIDDLTFLAISLLHDFVILGDNDFFVWSSENQIAMGGGKDGFAFVFDSDFATGESFCSATFGNPLLVHKENGSFRVANVECWGFEGLFGRVTKSSTRF